MKSQCDLLKEDGKPCLKRLYKLNEEAIKGQRKELVRESVVDIMETL